MTDETTKTSITTGSSPAKEVVALPSGPVDLVEKEFPTRLFGYDKQSVHTFMVSLARDWEGLTSSYRVAADALEASRALEAGERPYEALGADVAGILDAARLHGESLRRDAEEVLAEAERDRERILAEAEEERGRILTRALDERSSLEESNARLRSQLEAVVSSVSPVLGQVPDEKQFTEDVPRDVRRQLREETTIFTRSDAPVEVVQGSGEYNETTSAHNGGGVAHLEEMLGQGSTRRR